MLCLVTKELLIFLFWKDLLRTFSRCVIFWRALVPCNLSVVAAPCRQKTATLIVIYKKDPGVVGDNLNHKNMHAK